MSQRLGNRLLNLAARLKARTALGRTLAPTLHNSLGLAREAEAALEEARGLTDWERARALLGAQRAALSAKGLPAAAFEARSARDFLAAVEPGWRGVRRLTSDEWQPVWAALAQADGWAALRLTALNQLRLSA